MSRHSVFGCAALVAGLVLTAFLSAQGLPSDNDWSPGGQLFPLTLIYNQAVQQELGVSSEQKEKLTAIEDKLVKMRAETGLAYEKSSPEERARLREQAPTLRQQLKEKYFTKLQDVLRTEQSERLVQIGYQLGGPSAFSNPEVGKALEFTEQQQEKFAAVKKDFETRMKDLQAKTQEKIRGLFSGGTAGAEAREAMAKRQEGMARLQEEQKGELVKVLTKEQSEKWTALQGKTFDVAKIEFVRGTIYPAGSRLGPFGGRPADSGITRAEKVPRDTPPAERAPAPEKSQPPANLKLDAAKTVRLSKLLQNLYVLNELNISDEVYARLKDVKDQERAVSDELSKELAATRNLPPAERAERSRNFFPAYQARKTAVEESCAFQRFGLLTGPQLVRLCQLDVQDRGIDAYYADDVAAVLKLTDEQNKRIDEIYLAYEKKFKPFFIVGNIREDQIIHSTQPGVVELVKERDAKVEQVLGKEQLEKLAELRGKPFELSRLGPAIGDPLGIDRARPRISLMLLEMISHEAVRKDLKLTPGEEAGIIAAMDRRQKTGEEFWRLAKEEKPERELSAVQKALKIQETDRDRMGGVQKLQQDFAADVSKHVKDSHLKRLNQINLQRDWRSLRTSGGVAFGGGFGGTNELGLTADQVTKMRAIESDFRQKKSALLGLGGFGALGVVKDMIERRRELARQEETQYLEVLTPEQRQKLKELQGPPFDVSIFDPLAQFSAPPAIANGKDSLEARFDQNVIDYVNDTLLREQDTNGDGFLDKSEWVKGKWSAANPPENSDLNKDGKLSREELCIRISKSRGIPIKGEQPQPVPDSSK